MPRIKGIDEDETIAPDDDSLYEANEYDKLFDDIETVNLSDDLAQGAQEAGESVQQVLQEEVSRSRRMEAGRKRERTILRKQLAKENVFLNLDNSAREAKIREICRLTITTNSLNRLISHSNQLQTFIEEAVNETQTERTKLKRSQKIALLKECHARNPKWLAFLAEVVKTCFPEINIYKTRCNPIEFRDIILEALLVPITNLAHKGQIATWHSNNGGPVEEKMRQRMAELLQRRLK